MLEIGCAYILGIFLVYTLIGLGILQVLHIFNTPHFMASVGAVLLVVLGLINITDQLVPSFPIKLRIPHAAHHRMAELMEKGSLPSAFVLGGLVGHWSVLAMAFAALLLLTGAFLMPSHRAGKSSAAVEQLERDMKKCC